MRGLTSMILSFLGGIVGAVAFLGTVGADRLQQSQKNISADSIVARSIDIVDGSGKKAMTLAVSADTPSIFLRGKESAGMSIDSHAISIQETNGTPVVEITTSGRAGPLIAVTDRDRTAAARLGTQKDTAFVTVGPAGKPAPGTDLYYFKGMVGMRVADTRGFTRVSAGQMGPGTGSRYGSPVGSLKVYDEAGNVVWQVPR